MTDMQYIFFHDIFSNIKQYCVCRYESLEEIQNEMMYII